MTNAEGRRCVITSRPRLLDGEEPLSAVDPSELAEGCLCYVQENASLYMYFADGRSSQGVPDVIESRYGGQWQRSVAGLGG